MRVLVACEFSGTVRDAFAARGHDAWSCDLLETEKPGQHVIGDVLLELGKGWDLLICHPPCTYLAASGLHWNTRIPGREIETEKALQFVRMLLNAPVGKIALENPIGCIGTRIRPYDQIIQPYQFGHDASKATCLWLKNLPKLQPTGFVEPEFSCRCGTRFSFSLGAYGCPSCAGDRGKAKMVWGNQTPSGQNKLGPSPDRWKERSRTYQGIADAMAAQWG